jgi:predicted DNA-binding transcriptional regulator YafY
VADNGKSVRTYRAANLHDAQLGNDRFTRPKNFDLVAHWEKSVREYEGGVYRGYADVRLSPEGMRRLDVLGPHVTSAATKTAGKPDRQGWVRCHLPIEGGEFGIRELLRLGSEAIVIGPPEVRAQMADVAGRIASLHSKQRRRTGTARR